MCDNGQTSEAYPWPVCARVFSHMYLWDLVVDKARNLALIMPARLQLALRESPHRG
jgi:hypothetical protein